MNTIEDLLIKIINETKGCRIHELMNILYSKTEYTKELLETANSSEFLDKTTEEQIIELSTIIQNLVKEDKVKYLIYAPIPSNKSMTTFLFPKESKIISPDFLKESKTDNNISIGASILYIFMIISWIFGIALSTGWVEIVLAIFIIPYAWVVNAQWIIELVNKIIG